jgi:hypothetical protein
VYIFVGAVLGINWNQFDISSIVPAAMVDRVSFNNTQMWNNSGPVSLDSSVFVRAGALSGSGLGMGGQAVAYVPSTAATQWEHMNNTEFFSVKNSILSFYTFGDTACSSQVGIGGCRLTL